MSILVIIVNPRGRFPVKIDFSFFYHKDYGCFIAPSNSCFWRLYFFYSIDSRRALLFKL